MYINQNKEEEERTKLNFLSKQKKREKKLHED